MKQTLTLKLGQQLTMTPQLQQAIKLLQLSTLDLQQEIQQAIESNPLLELLDDDIELAEADQELSDAIADGLESPSLDGGADGGADGDEAIDGDGLDLESLDIEGSTADGEDFADGESSFDDFASDFEDASAPTEYEAEPVAADDPAAEDTWAEAIPEDLPVDGNWDDVFTSSAASGPADDENSSRPEDSSTDSLQENLQWQLNLLPLSETDQLIGAALIDAIGEDGYLTATIEDIHSGLAEELEIDLEEVEVVLHCIQQFEPSGVAARDLRECLLIQLKQLGAAAPSQLQERAIELVSSHLDLLAQHDYRQLMRRLRVTEEVLKEIIAFIQDLNPRPGHAVDSGNADYVIPDVVVRRDGRRWVVELNPECTPRVRVNPFYAGLAREARNATDSQFLRENLQEARWFLKSLQSRNETLLKVATQIVEVQRGFFEYGPEAMKPLVLQDIAEAVSMHESTISRVTTNKYMLTPRGVFELKYFFSSHVSTGSGGEVSSTAIRALIRKFTAEENPCKPLSDSRIASILKEMDINVARRTVAKYRESMAIPPSNERKRLV